jgi:hypothetical protein
MTRVGFSLQTVNQVYKLTVSAVLITEMYPLYTCHIKELLVTKGPNSFRTSIIPVSY